MWQRVFCRSAIEVKPAELLACLQAIDPSLIGRFKGDDLGWTMAELVVGPGTPIYVERYLATEDNLRDDLNTWAGWLETQDFSPNHGRLMEHVIQTQQLITIRKPLDQANEARVDRICREVCAAIAGSADGIYQVENDGWYASDGELLLHEY